MKTVPRTGCGLLALALGAFAPSVPAGERTTFDPKITLSHRYTDNVRILEDNTASSDASTRLSIGLNLGHEMKNGSLEFNYTTGYIKYQDFDELDHTGHLLSFGLNTSPGRGSLSVSTWFRRSQDQGEPDSLDEADLFLAQRTTRELIRTSVSYRRSVASGRWQWDVGVRGDRSRFEAIADFDSGTALTAVEDRIGYSGRLGFGRTVSPRTSVGVEYRYKEFELDVSQDETVNSFRFTLKHAATRKTAVNVRLGAFDRSQDPNPTAPTVDLDGTGFSGRVSVIHGFKSYTLAFDAGHSPSSGGARQGTSTDTAVGLSLVPTLESGRVARRRWDWRLWTKYARRDPSDRTAPSIDSIGLGTWLERTFRFPLGLRLGALIVDQSGESAADDGSFYKTNVSLIYRPLANTRIGSN